jgi:surface carbohydrate biosynthesis protein
MFARWTPTNTPAPGAIISATFYRSLNPPCKENIQTTGHPRFDLYKPKHRAFYDADVQRIKNTYGEYVLINTNFSFVNNRNGSRVSFSSRFFYGDPKEGSARLDHIHHWAHTSRTLINFVTLVMRLSIEMPHLNFVIRPHPSKTSTTTCRFSRRARMCTSFTRVVWGRGSGEQSAHSRWLHDSH